MYSKKDTSGTRQGQTLRETQAMEMETDGGTRRIRQGHGKGDKRQGKGRQGGRQADRTSE